MSEKLNLKHLECLNPEDVNEAALKALIAVNEAIKKLSHTEKTWVLSTLSGLLYQTPPLTEK